MKPVIKTDNDRKYITEGWTAYLIADTEKTLDKLVQYMINLELIEYADCPKPWSDDRPSITLFANTTHADTKKQWIKTLRQVINPIQPRKKHMEIFLDELYQD